MNEKLVNVNEHTTEKITNLIKNHDVVLFMKGDATSPRCGFSKAVVDILNHFKLDWHAVNVLEDEHLREGIKNYSNWPTIPQLYIKQEFIGGCDIAIEMYNNGEIRDLLLKHHLIS